MIKKAFVALGIILLIGGRAAAFPNGLVFNGYAKAFLMVYRFTERTAEWYSLDPANMASVHNRLRLKVRPLAVSGEAPRVQLRAVEVTGQKAR